MPVDDLTRLLCRYFGTAHALPTGRAALGIYAALRAWSGGRPMIVALPASVCQDVIAAVRMAGWTPLFCDVDPKTGLATDVEWVKARHAGATAAIVVHLYGNAADTASVRKTFPSPAYLLIDDAAQALGARTSQSLAGTGGDIGIISFGATKHIEVGGAAMLGDDARLLRECELVLRDIVPTSADALSTRQASFRSRYQTAKRRLVCDGDRQGFAGLLDDYEPLLKVGWQPAWSVAIARQLEGYSAALSLRRKKAAMWSQNIAGSGLVPVGMSPDKDCAPWRYACRLPGCDWIGQATIGDRMRRQGLNVSHWYLPGNWWLDAAGPPLVGSERLGQEAFQFWLDAATDQDVIARAGSILANSIGPKK